MLRRSVVLFVWMLAQAQHLATAQTAPPATGDEASPPETYRIRIQNVEFGRIEISVDGGARYALVGRVMHPATKTAPDRIATLAGIVLRGDADGFTFSVGAGAVLSVRPYAQPAHARPGHRPPLLQPRPPDPTAVVTDMPPGKGLFGDLLPSFRSTAALQIDASAQMPFSPYFAPTEDDTYVIAVSLVDADDVSAAAARQAKLRARVETIARSYEEDMLARARAAKRLIIAGTLTLRANLPPNEPDPIKYVTFAIDGTEVGMGNVKPYTCSSDTRRFPDGEHIVEIRALNESGTVVTRTRALIVVRNGSTAPGRP